MRSSKNLEWKQERNEEKRIDRPRDEEQHAMVLQAGESQCQERDATQFNVGEMLAEDGLVGFSDLVIHEVGIHFLEGDGVNIMSFQSNTKLV